MDRNIHLYAVVRVKVRVPDSKAKTDVEAINFALDEFLKDTRSYIKDGEYAEEYQDMALVDPLLENGEVDYSKAQWYKEPKDPYLEWMPEAPGA